MKTWVVFLAMAAMLAFGNAWAQVDPAENGIGIYFDEGATINCDSPGAVGPVDMFLCLTNITTPGGVSGWECRIDITEGFFILNMVLRGSAVNAATPPEFTVGLAQPLPWSPVIVVADMTVGLFTPDTVELYIGPTFNPSIPDVPVFADGDDPSNLLPLSQSTGGADIPVMVMNGDCPVANEDETWGSVKALYR